MSAPMCKGFENTCGFPAGRTMDAAVQVVIEHVNDASLVHDDDKLVVEVLDDRCDPDHGMSLFCFFVFFGRSAHFPRSHCKAHRQPDGLVSITPRRQRGKGNDDARTKGSCRRQGLSRGCGWLPRRSCTAFATMQPQLYTKARKVQHKHNNYLTHRVSKMYGARWTKLRQHSLAGRDKKDRNPCPTDWA